MHEKLAEVERRYEELNVLLSDPEVVSDHTKYSSYAKEHAELGEVVKCFRELQKVQKELKGAKELIEEAVDGEMKELAQMELDSLTASEEELEQKLLLLLAPKDPNDDKNIIIELRAGAGGDESGAWRHRHLRRHSYVLVRSLGGLRGQHHTDGRRDARPSAATAYEAAPTTMEY